MRTHCTANTHVCARDGDTQEFDLKEAVRLHEHNRTGADRDLPPWPTCLPNTADRNTREKVWRERTRRKTKHFLSANKKGFPQNSRLPLVAYYCVYIRWVIPALSWAACNKVQVSYYNHIIIYEMIYAHSVVLQHVSTTDSFSAFVSRTKKRCNHDKTPRFGL